METQQEYLIDDFGYKTKEIRVLPTGGSSNALVGYRGYLREITYRKERNRSILHPVCKPFDLPEWEDLKVYDKV